jgi:ribonuclease HII
MLKKRFKDDNTIEIGIDEAGRGSFWGPLMAGAMILPSESTMTTAQQQLLLEIRDSKKISHKKRARIAHQINELFSKTAVGIVTAQEINENGITWANTEAFIRAINQLSLSEDEMHNARLLIDGVLKIPEWNGGGEQELIIEGDSKYLAIAGASILAKVEHDKWIVQYCETHPECNEHYDLINSKGYGTQKHRDGIQKYGGHEHHRTLYIKNWLSPRLIKNNKSLNFEECLIKL